MSGRGSDVTRAAQAHEMTEGLAPSIGDRVRFMLLYRDAMRPLLWLRVGTDGSIYTGVLLGQPSFSRSIDKRAAPRVDVQYAEATERPAPRKGSRVSFKAASGEIHLGDRVLQGRSLQRLGERRQLCLIQFIHPQRYRSAKPAKDKEFDIGIAEYPVD
jgi:hypothetical protein